MGRRVWTSLFLILLTSTAFAKVKITGFSGYSNYDMGSTATATPIVYGGTAGSAASCSGTSTCNNCTGSGLVACNHQRITTNTNLRVFFNSTGDGSQAGYATVAKDSDGTSIKQNTGTTFNKGDAAYIDISWGEICNQLGSSDCETVTSSGSTLNSAVILRVGIDSSTSPDQTLAGTNDDYAKVSFKLQKSMADTVSTTTEGSSATGTNGIYEFTVFPGDAKVYVEDITAWPGFPTSVQSIQYSQMILMFQEAASCAAGNGLFNNAFDSSNSMTATINSDGTLDDNRFMDLTNDVSYVFKIGLQDQAGNIGLFYPTCDDTKHLAIPGEVFGLLKNQQNCFIATAAFGSPFADKVKTFRNFRDAVLLKSSIGKKLVSKYYDYSPPLAQFIADSPKLKKATQVVLYPLWAFASMTLQIGLFNTFLILTGVAAAAVVVIRRYFRETTK